MSSLSYLVSRLLQIIPTFLLVMVVIFLLVRMLPGDPAIAMADAKATEAQLELIRQKLGLNEPLVMQFFYFVRNTLSGDMGTSILLKAPVLEVIIERIPVTAFLTLYAVCLSILIAGPLAFVAALNKNRGLDIAIRSGFQVGLSTPVFYIGLLLLTFLAASLRLFPVGGYGTTFLQHLHHLMLPALTVALYTSAIIMRNLRSAVIEVLDADYVQFARSKGLSRSVILGRHVLRNALISTVTLLGLSIGNLMSGTLVTETVFAVPGLGRLMLEAIFARDYPLIQGLTLTFAVMVSLVFLFTDMVQAWLDPRLRLS
ncbi:Glutathione transport system permease protein GsiC [Pseudovibrio sp. W64]|uniref:ABC transporter permease n=1 Tax=unclassified Pseudovibrio TaxID=2627060 RepID=UPI0007AEC015|nr:MULTISPECIES: ABC transporter permease [unclassified Pseudovibrio]KZK87786.1 Glutathione transport system permease protein GsiC [Pseudovibrio sp. W64]KZK88430.1 Glutathione transport system permease protein GsiC [Pseudovibrio sp. Ad46]KZK91009.1 Glutathione transport system permease protein GsiC [Pseudovibrio sp. Ad5]KZL03623.1 Glutathione transport system permease protein GsiC [Pseudovibrio sp. W74]KZL09663.1 Glutathione transport system permease protein GsiC [Pseudovibrio sp. Ad14]